MKPKRKNEYYNWTPSVLKHKDFTSFIDSHIRRVGKKRVTHCPFHNDKTPSFFIYPDNSFYCFSCKEGGDAITFVMRKFDCSFADACTILEGL